MTLGEMYKRMMARRFPGLTEQQAEIRGQAEYDAENAANRAAWLDAYPPSKPEQGAPVP